MVEWPLARKRATGTGTGIGLAVGALSGAVLGAVSGDDCSGGEWLCFSQEQLALVGAVALGAIGASVGGTIGYFSHVTVWEKANDAGSSLTIRPRVGLGTLGLAGSFRF